MRPHKFIGIALAVTYSCTPVAHASDLSLGYQSQKPSQVDYSSFGRTVGNARSMSDNNGSGSFTSGGGMGGFAGGALQGIQGGSGLGQIGSMPGFSGGSLPGSTSSTGSGGMLDTLSNLNTNQILAIAGAGTMLYGAVTGNKTALGVGTALTIGSTINFDNGVDNQNIVKGGSAVLSGTGIATGNNQLSNVGNQLVRVSQPQQQQQQQQPMTYQQPTQTQQQPVWQTPGYVADTTPTYQQPVTESQVQASAARDQQIQAASDAWYDQNLVTGTPAATYPTSTTSTTSENFTREPSYLYVPRKPRSELKSSAPLQTNQQQEF